MALRGIRGSSGVVVMVSTTRAGSAPCCGGLSSGWRPGAELPLGTCQSRPAACSLCRGFVSPACSEVSGVAVSEPSDPHRLSRREGGPLRVRSIMSHRLRRRSDANPNAGPPASPRVRPPDSPLAAGRRRAAPAARRTASRAAALAAPDPPYGCGGRRVGPAAAGVSHQQLVRWPLESAHSTCASGSRASLRSEGWGLGLLPAVDGAVEPSGTPFRGPPVDRRRRPSPTSDTVRRRRGG